MSPETCTGVEVPGAARWPSRTCAAERSLSPVGWPGTPSGRAVGTWVPTGGEETAPGARLWGASALPGTAWAGGRRRGVGPAAPQDVRGGPGAPGRVAVSPRAAGRGEGALGRLPSRTLAGGRRRVRQRGTLPPSGKDAGRARAVSWRRVQGVWQGGAGRGLGPSARSTAGQWRGVRSTWHSSGSQQSRVSPRPSSP